MPKRHYLPRADGARNRWLNNFAEKLPAYAVTLDIVPDDVDFVQKANNIWPYALLLNREAKNFSKAMRSWKSSLRDKGVTDGPPPALVFPPVPPLPDGPVFPRIMSIVARMKTHKNYNNPMGSNLGIIGPEADHNVENWQPRLKVSFTGGKVRIGWRKGRATGIDIYVCRDGATWHLLTTDTKSPAWDEQPLPEQPGRWQYKAVYRFNDEQVGQWSAISSVVVGR